MLLRNIDPSEGLCNGTRLIIKSFRTNVIDIVISSGEFVGKQVFLHRIQFRISADSNCPIPFERTQFPVIKVMKNTMYEMISFYNMITVPRCPSSSVGRAQGS